MREVFWKKSEIGRSQRCQSAIRRLEFCTRMSIYGMTRFSNKIRYHRRIDRNGYCQIWVSRENDLKDNGESETKYIYKGNEPES